MNHSKLMLMAASMITFSSLANTSIVSSYTENTKQYKVLKGDTALYQAQLDWSRNNIKLSVSKGHASQMGSLLITKKEVIARDVNGSLLWRDERADLPLCLPELFGEFALSYFDELKAGKSIKCLGPILKAKKLAPFKFNLVSSKGERHTIEVGPGSLGMMFFMDTIEFQLDLSVLQVTKFKGLSPAPMALVGKMRYLEIDKEQGLNLNYQVAKIDKKVFESW